VHTRGAADTRRWCGWWVQVGENHGVNSGVVAMSAIAALVVAVALGVGHGAVARGLVGIVQATCLVVCHCLSIVPATCLSIAMTHHYTCRIVPATCVVVCHCSLFALLWCGPCLVWCMHLSCAASGHAPVSTLCCAPYAAHLMLRTLSFAASPCGVDNEEVLCMRQAATKCQPRIWVGIEA